MNRLKVHRYTSTGKFCYLYFIVFYKFNSPANKTTDDLILRLALLSLHFFLSVHGDDQLSSALAHLPHKTTRLSRMEEFFSETSTIILGIVKAQRDLPPIFQHQQILALSLIHI